MAPEHIPSLRGRATILTVISVVILIALCLLLWMYRNTPPLSHLLGATQTPSADQIAQQGYTYTSSEYNFSILLPSGYKVDQLTRDHSAGMKFVIPSSAAEGTNLSSDSYISVEQLQGTTTCSASTFSSNATPVTLPAITDQGVTYSVVQETGAGAGNIYEETIYTIVNSNPCTAVRYFIHSTQIGNYPAGTVREFDKGSLVAEFDQIRRSLVIGR